MFRNRKAWSEKENKYLVENYKFKKVQLMATELGRSISSVETQLKKLRKYGVILYCSQRDKNINRLEYKYHIPIQELLYNYHWIDEKPILYMAKEFEIDRTTVTELMKSFNIPHRTISEDNIRQCKLMTKEERKKRIEKAQEATRATKGIPRPHLRGRNSPNWNGGLQTYVCCQCGEEFKREPSRTVGGFVTCSRKCTYKELSIRLSGENNPLWKGGTKSYRGNDWREASGRAKSRDHYTCQRCGMTENECLINYGFVLHVHHITPYRLTQDNSLVNLVTLCVSCHSYVENHYTTK
jgi:5-methylcytosine-specific restriction endonuclease McrA